VLKDGKRECSIRETVDVVSASIILFDIGWAVVGLNSQTAQTFPLVLPSTHPTTSLAEGSSPGRRRRAHHREQDQRHSSSITDGQHARRSLQPLAWPGAHSDRGGGVISAILDTVGGFAAFLGVLTRETRESANAEFSPWLSTIDMRTDFLRPGVGTEFTATGFPQRVGSRLVVTRMKLHNDAGDLIAVGTGTYVVP